MNRIERRFRELFLQGKKAFIPFITVSDPNLSITYEIVKLFIETGVSLIELGHPFSDPLADGPVIQASSQRALESGVNTEKIFDFVSKVRDIDRDIPLVLMGYYNPIYQYGLESFAKRCEEVGIDGTIVPDLPMEEAKDWIKICKRYGIYNIMLVTPTTPIQRAKKIIDISEGFVYYVSVTGITGVRETLPQDLEENLKIIKKISNKPICVGFGISKPEHVRLVSNYCDGVIVGSAIIRILQNSLENDSVKNSSSYSKDNLFRELSEFLKKMIMALN